MFKDAADPTRHLTPPPQRDEKILGQPFSNPGSALDWLSPTHLINEFIKEAAGYDIVGEAAKVFGGDWEQVWSMSGAFRNLALAMQDVGINVSSGNVDLDSQWDGNAADAAFMYFAGLSSATSAQQIALNAIADEYEKAAEGIYRISEAVSGIIKDIFDAAMIGVAGASAGTATIETGVGFITGWGVASYEMYKIGSLAADAKQLISAANALIGGVVGYIQGFSAEGGALDRYPLPSTAYQHPGAS